MNVDEADRRNRPWLSRYPWQVAPSCEYPAGNAAGLLAELAAKEPGAKLIWGNSAWTCSRLYRSCRQFANGLLGLGISRGERVATMLPEGPQAFVAFYGTLLAQAVAVPMEDDLPDEEARRRLAETGAKVLVAPDSALARAAALRTGTEVGKIVAAAKTGALSSLRARLPAFPPLPPLSRGDKAALYRSGAVVPWGSLLGRLPKEDGFPVDPEAGERLAAIRYTRGTTGTPKGVMLTHANLIAGAVQHAAWHYGDKEALARMLAALPKGGGALPPGRLKGSYVLAETAAPSLAQPANRFGRPGTIGIPLPDTEARIVGGDSLKPLAPGEVGELAIRGPQVMAGYWNRPEETDAVLREGWLRTGDMATADEDGFFSFADRKLDLIRKGDTIVYPAKVERELIRHPAVEDAVVYGVPAAGGEEEVAACIVLRREVKISEAQLKRWGAERLSAAEEPAFYEFRDRIPSRLRLRERSRADEEGGNLKID
ncbi:AMP-binding protein [Cohnella xylanilytica]|uniref:AMP-binding protein n=1 Tax=Cohnella xylanilytica TaxID=557555 RepID=UPI001BB43423|nr:AMP-binding protein [Cohnella xylanilytica]